MSSYDKIEFLRELREAVSEVQSLGCGSFEDGCAIGVYLRRRGFSSVQMMKFGVPACATLLAEDIGLDPSVNELLDELVEFNDSCTDDISINLPFTRSEIRRGLVLKWIDDKIKELQSP